MHKCPPKVRGVNLHETKKRVSGPRIHAKKGGFDFWISAQENFGVRKFWKIAKNDFPWASGSRPHFGPNCRPQGPILDPQKTRFLGSGGASQGRSWTGPGEAKKGQFWGFLGDLPETPFLAILGVTRGPPIDPIDEKDNRTFSSIWSIYNHYRQPYSYDCCMWHANKSRGTYLTWGICHERIIHR